MSKDVEKNILIVSQDKNRPAKSTDIFMLLDNVNWISSIPEENKKYTAQIRYHGEFLSCKVICEGSSAAKVIFEKPILIAPGQSIVVYDKDVVLGGGVVV